MIIHDNRPYPYKRLFLRLIDVCILGIFYFIGGVIISKILTHIFPKYTEEEYNEVSTPILTIELMLHASLIMLFAF